MLSHKEKVEFQSMVSPKSLKRTLDVQCKNQSTGKKLLGRVPVKLTVYTCINVVVFNYTRASNHPKGMTEQARIASKNRRLHLSGIQRVIVHLASSKGSAHPIYKYNYSGIVI